MSRRRAISIIGARGIGNYGGFETFVKEVAPLLHNKGIDVYCTCERTPKILGKSEYKGVKLVYFLLLPPLKYSARKVFEVIYDNWFLVTSSFYSDSIVLLTTLGAPMVLFPRLLGKKIFINIDGIEWRRDKFSKLEKTIMKVSLKVCMVMGNKVIIDSRQLFDEVPDNLKDKAVFIPYGVYEYPQIKSDSDIESFLNKYGLKEGQYWLAIARLEPENNIHMIVEGFTKANTGKKLVIVGNFTNNGYRDEVLKFSNPNIIFVGHIFNQTLLNYLRQNCLGYMHGHSIGGTNPSLLEAMSAKAIIAAHSNKFNKEVMTECGLYFGSAGELSSIIKNVEHQPDNYSDMAKEGQTRVLKEYSWDRVAQSYEELTRDAC